MKTNQPKTWLIIPLLWLAVSQAIGDLDCSDSDEFAYDARWLRPSFGESDEFPFDARWVNPTFGESAEFDLDPNRVEIGRAWGDSAEFDLSAPTVECAFFDDFSYAGPHDPTLAGRWYVRSGKGGPGHAQATWDPNLVVFVQDPDSTGNVLLQMHATTSGTPQSSAQSEIGTCQGFFEGTYGARIHFTNDPRYAAPPQPSVQAFFTINSLRCSPIYSECDFEYLPYDVWEPYCPDPALYMISWDWSCDDPNDPNAPDDPNDMNDQKELCGPEGLADWHTYCIQVTDGQVRYYVDYEQKAMHTGVYYPDAPMAILLQHWFAYPEDPPPPLLLLAYDFIMHVDWVYYAQDVTLMPSQVQTIVAQYRAGGAAYDNTLPNDPGSDLRQLVPEGVLFGGAVNRQVKPGSSSYDDEQFKLNFAHSFNLATLENEHKAGVKLPDQEHSMWRGPDEYDFSEADKIVEWCLSRNPPIAVKFHTLVWDNPRDDKGLGRWVNDGVPGWLLDGVPDDPNDPYDPNKPYYPDDVRNMLRDYIDAVLEHYCGHPDFSDRPDLKIELYDVVNEWFDQREDEDGLRENWWKLHAGEDVLEQAFVWAEQTADFLRCQGVDFYPTFIYNDFNLITDPDKGDLVFAVLDFLKNTQGVPIDAVGFQSHFCDTLIDETFLETQVGPRFQEFRDAGFAIYVSEFDTRAMFDLETQGQHYRDYLAFCLKEGVEAFQTWDFWDGDTPWCQPGCEGCRPGLFDDCWNRKPSYYGFYDALSSYHGQGDSGTPVAPDSIRPAPPP
jgi:endo-1,3-1,4-beta-glycanase ExoK